MATRDEVTRALAGLPDTSGAIVTEPTDDGAALRGVATRPPAKNGGLVLLVLHAGRAPGGSAINATVS
jgi:hypothetical protein